MRTLLANVFAIATTLSLFWLGGFNFDERGEDAALCAFVTLLACFLATLFSKISLLE